MTATPRTDPAPRRVAFAVVLRGALPPALVAGLVAALVIAVVQGVSAGLAAVLGVLIAVAFFGLGLLVVSRFVGDTGNPLLFMAVGMSVYLAQVMLLLGVLVVAREVRSFDSRPAGIAMLVTVLAWQVAQMRAWRRARVPVYDAVRLPDDAHGAVS